MVLRLIFLTLVVLPFTLIALPIYCLLALLGSPMRAMLALAFFKLMAIGLGLRVSLMGVPHADGPVLLVANHIGWLDIIAVASKIPVNFVAKAEVAGWPVVGFLARLYGTIFVDRKRRTDTGRTAREMAARIGQGMPVLLFAEGTSDLGTHVLPFRSALMGAASGAMTENAEVAIQPLAIAYTAISGLPLSRSERRQVAWIGDMSVGDNLGAILKSGRKDVVLAFGTPISASLDRKRLALEAEGKVRAMLVALNRSLPLPSDEILV